MDFTIRQATPQDIPFIAKTIIEAERGISGELGIANFFSLTEQEFETYLIQMLEEEVDGCEFSLSSFIVATFEEQVVAALGGWMEGYYDDMASNMLKANLINFTLPQEILVQSQERNSILKDIKIQREMGAYQIEYTYVHPDFRGKRLMYTLMQEQLHIAKNTYNAQKVRASLFVNNNFSLAICEKLGFVEVKRYCSSHPDIYKYAQHNERIVMEKIL